jgi:hypothetical protein
VSKTVYVLGISVLLLTGLSGQAAAQGQPSADPSAFINVGVGAQPQRRTLAATSSFPLYDEIATIAATQQIRSGAFFEVSGGYRVAPRFAVAAGFSSFGRPGTGTLTASIPDPIFYDRPATSSRDLGDLKHTERGIHVQALYFLPVSPKIDLALSAGPSFIRVSQQLPAMTVAADQSVTVGTTTESGTAKGFNAGLQTNYMFAPRYGVGFFVGYAGGSVDLPGAAGVKAGGVRTGVALQARF